MEVFGKGGRGKDNSDNELFDSVVSQCFNRQLDITCGLTVPWLLINLQALALDNLSNPNTGQKNVADDFLQNLFYFLIGDSSGKFVHSSLQTDMMVFQLFIFLRKHTLRKFCDKNT